MAKSQGGTAALLERVTQLAQPLALEMGLELWDVEYKKEGGMFGAALHARRAAGG